MAKKRGRKRKVSKVAGLTKRFNKAKSICIKKKAKKLTACVKSRL